MTEASLEPKTDRKNLGTQQKALAINLDRRKYGTFAEIGVAALDGGNAGLTGKFGFNLPDDGLVGQQLFAGEATRLAYGTEEAKEGRSAFVEKRKRDFSRFPWHF